MSVRSWKHTALRKLRREYPHRQTRLIAQELGRSESSVYQQAMREGLCKSAEYLATPAVCRLRRGNSIGSAHRFQKGHAPWNKGTHWTAGGRSAETRYRAGHMGGRAAQLLRPVGALRINSDGYLEQKVTADGPGWRRWKAVHRLVWERENGPTPSGHIIVFKPGRRTTNVHAITLDCVELISRVENMRRNTYHRYPKEIARLVQLRGALNRQINKRERHEKQD